MPHEGRIRNSDWGLIPENNFPLKSAREVSRGGSLVFPFALPH
jgi:hypothetical protein